MKLKRIALSVSLAFLVEGSAFAAAPTSGAYTTDPQQEWVQDRLAEQIGSPNMIMCFIGALRPDAMVNQGNYVALVDMDKCESGKRGEDSSASTSAGASAATDYTRVVVNSARASNTDQMIANAWFVVGGGGAPERIFARVNVTESPSTANPNGVFSVSFCGVPADRINPATTGACDTFLGSLSADATALTFTENGTQDHGSGPVGYTTRLTLSKAGNSSGSGRILSTETGSTDVDLAFIFGTEYFERGATDPGQCFSRDRNLADYSTWRYGVYKADGSRLDLANPGFPIQATYNGSTYWGGAGFWGVFLPEMVLNNVTQVNRMTPGSSTTTPYNLSKSGGKLYKMTKVAGVLDDLKGQPVMLHLPANVVAGDATGGQYEVNWDGANLVVARKQDACGPTGCTWTDLSATPLTVTATNLRTAAPWMKALQGWSQSAGGEIRIEVPQSGEFLTTTATANRTREAVIPGSATPSLVCINRCPKGDLVNADFSGTPGDTPYQSILTNNWGGGGTSSVPSENAFQPVATTNALPYSFSNGGLLMSGASAVDASALTLGGNHQWGLQSGRLLVAGSASYDQARCDANNQPDPAGINLCPWLVDDAPEYYTYETGPNAWNRYVGLTAVGGGAVTFDPPINFTLTVATDNTTVPAGSPLIGSKVQLNYNGFGELQGLPGQCVNKDTNAPETCSGGGGDQRWVPAFSIKDGAALTSANPAGTYYVKYLEREMRFAQVAASNCSALTLPTGVTLPSAPTSANDPRAAMGAEPTVTTAPKVIHGVVQ